MSSRVPLRVSDSDVSVVRAEVSRLEAAYKNYEAGRKWGIGGYGGRGKGTVMRAITHITWGSTAPSPRHLNLIRF